MRNLTFIYTILITLLLAVAPVHAQKKGTATTQKKTATAQKKTTTSQKKTATTQKRTASQKNTTTQKKTSTKKRGKSKSTSYETTAEIRGLQKERSQIQKEISNKERELKAKEHDVRQRLDNLVLINTEIEQQRTNINDIQKDIKVIDGDIDILKSQLASLESQLDERKAKFIKSMRYMARHNSIQDKLMFIFSAKNLTQVYRRLRFVREYAAYQRAQGQLVREKQEQVTQKHKQLAQVRGNKNNLLSKGRQAEATLQGKQQEQQKVVESLRAKDPTGSHRPTATEAGSPQLTDRPPRSHRDSEGT